MFIVLINIYLVHYYFNENGFSSYRKINQEYERSIEVYNKNQEIIKEKSELLKIIKSNLIKNNDDLEVLVKENFDYKKNGEKVIIIN